jgi:hypothetical protein
MKLNPTSTQPLIFSYGRFYLQKPHPPTQEAVKRAQFVDKTYVWQRK